MSDTIEIKYLDGDLEVKAIVSFSFLFGLRACAIKRGALVAIVRGFSVILSCAVCPPFPPLTQVPLVSL